MRFNPDTQHLLGGTTAGVYIDGTLRVSNAGKWGWVGSATAMGPGGWNTAQPGLYSYDLPNGPATLVALADAEHYYYAATEFFANGAGKWVLYYQDNHTGSYDSEGNHYPDAAALGYDGDYQIFTDWATYQSLLCRDSVTGKVTPLTVANGWARLPNDNFFSRDYRGCWHQGVWYACGYRPEYGGMCLWAPFVQQPTYLLSKADDFHPDIASRGATLVIGSGENQGEAGQNLYVVDLATKTFNKDGQAPQPLVDVNAPLPVPPIPKIGRFVWEGPFFFGRQAGLPQFGNCRVLVNGAEYSRIGYPQHCFASIAEAPAVPPKALLGIWFGFEGGVLSPDGDAAYAKSLTFAKAHNVPLIVYWDSENGIPQAVLDRYVNELNIYPAWPAYPKHKSLDQPLLATPDEDVARARAVAAELCKRYQRVVMSRTMYLQRGGNPLRPNYPLSHVLAMQPGLTEIVRDFPQLYADLWFVEDRDPPGAIAGNPELIEVGHRILAGIVGEPGSVLIPSPTPPQPEPIPPQPQPIPPEPQPQPPQPQPIPPTPTPLPPVPQEPPEMLYNPALVTGMKMGKLVPVSGGVALRKDNGYYMSVSPNGDIDQRPNDGSDPNKYTPGSWETFRQSGAFLVADREGDRTYAFYAIF